MTTNSQKQRYALYCRKSTEDSNRQILSLDSQEKELLALASTLEINIVQIFKESKSAKKPDNRPQFTELVNLIKKEKIDGILCWKIDRLSRNPIDSATIQWLLQQGQLKSIQTMERQYLPNDNALLFNVESGMANQYILDLSKNVKRGIRAKLEKGYWPNLAPIGYLNKSNNIVIDKARGKYIKKAFELYSTGKYGVKEIANILYQDGFRSRSGNKYHKSKIHKMLNSSFYCGIMEKDGQKYLGKYETIISKKLFDDAQEIMKQKAHVKKQVLPFAFRGLLKCAKCGCQLTATKKKGHLVYYYCTNGKGVCNEHKNYLKEESLSTALGRIFDSLVFSEELVELVYRAKLEENKDAYSYTAHSLVGLKNRLKSLEFRKDALLDVYLDKLVPVPDFEAKNKSLDNEIIDVKKTINDLETESSKQNEITLERIKNFFLAPKNIKKSFLGAHPEKQKEILIPILWNAEVANKKIANISFKQPYDVLSKIENKSDFDLVRRGGDSNPG